MDYKVGQGYKSPLTNYFIIIKATDTEITVKWQHGGIGTVSIPMFEQWIELAGWKLDLNREFQRELELI